MAHKVKAAFSAEGWSFVEWLKGNLKTIKEVLKVGIPLAISMFATDNIALQGLITAFGKLFLDTLEYIVKPRDL